MEDEDFFQGQLEPEYYPVNEHSLLQYLPMEIKWRIFSFLEPQELSQAMYVCREWAELMNEQSLRNNVFENGFQAVKQAQQIDAAHHRTWMARIANTIPIAHQERQLTPGLRRLRWTCLCGRNFFEDYYDPFLESLPRLQQSFALLHDRYWLEKSNIFDTISRKKLALEPPVNHKMKIPSAGAEFTSVSFNLPEKSTDQVERSATTKPGRMSDQQIVADGDSTSSESISPEVAEPEVPQALWALACYRKSTYLKVAVHANVLDATTDTDLLNEFRFQYFSIKGWIRRFFSLREVVSAKYVMFQFMRNGTVSIIKEDVWPDDVAAWLYEPYPARPLPMLGSDFLMHSWHNPHHADWKSYYEWKKESGRWSAWKEWFRIYPTLLRQRFRGVPLSRPSSMIPSQASGVDLENPLPPLSRLVVARTPKKVGRQLEMLTAANESVDGWGLSFEEKFQGHRLIFTILVAYLSVSLWLITRYLLRSENAALDFKQQLNWTLGWIGTFLGLFAAWWFKYAETR